MAFPKVLEQTELRRDDFGQVGFDVPELVVPGEIQPAERVPTRELEDLRRAGLEDKLRDALVPGFEHGSVERELVPLQPVLAEDPIVGGMRYEKDLVVLDESPGLGAEVDAAFLKKCQCLTI